MQGFEFRFWSPDFDCDRTVIVKARDKAEADVRLDEFTSEFTEAEITNTWFEGIHYIY